MRHIGLALWLVAPTEHARGVLRLKDIYSLRGLSCRLGAWLARIRHTELGRLIVSEITLRPMESE